MGGCANRNIIGIYYIYVNMENKQPTPEPVADRNRTARSGNAGCRSPRTTEASPGPARCAAPHCRNDAVGMPRPAGKGSNAAADFGGGAMSPDAGRPLPGRPARSGRWNGSSGGSAPAGSAVGIVPRTDGDFVHEPIFTTKSRETAAAGVGGDPSGRVPPALQPNRLGQGHPVAHPHHPDRDRSGLPLPESELGLRPIYHRKSVRAEGHLFITVIAHRLVQVIRTRLRAAGHRDGWTALRRILKGQPVTAIFRRDDGRTSHVRKATRPEAPQTAIHDAPGGTRKTIVRTDPKRTDVVPLDDLRHRNPMIYILTL